VWIWTGHKETVAQAAQGNAAIQLTGIDRLQCTKVVVATGAADVATTVVAFDPEPDPDPCPAVVVLM